jgi:flagellar motor protein MotB
MSISHTVVRQSSSYRQGLVLGLTLAEVILLIVFALLLALAAIWENEHRQNEQLQKEKAALESQLKESAALTDLARSDAVGSALLAEAGKRLRSTDRAKVMAILRRVASGENVSVISEAEDKYVSQIKDALQKSDPSKVDENWRELVLAASVENLAKKLEVAEAVSQAAPGVTDTRKIQEWLVAGKQAGNTGEHDWPPIINLHETDGYTFAKGRADLTPSFEQKLKREIIPELLVDTRKFGVDVIEVIGHTDEQAIAPRPSNLDLKLVDALKASGQIESLVAGDNAGLGLSRAVSVVRALMLDGRLPQAQYRILPLSGGQLIETDERITNGGGGDVPGRRRIEIRLRRSEQSLGRNN